MTSKNKHEGKASDPMSKFPFRCYILTRVNIGFRNGKTCAGHKVDHTKWLDARLKIFERFTLPSIMAQTEKRFRWLLFFSPETPDSFADRIAGYQRQCPQLVPVFSYMTCEKGGEEVERIRIRLGVKDDGREEKIELHSHIAAKVFGIIDGDLLANPTDWVLTTRIDSDDVVSKDFMDVIYRAKKDHHFISIPRGYVYDSRTKEVWKKNSAHNAWLTLVEPAIPGQIWTVWISAHTQPVTDYQRATNKTIPLIQRGTDRPRWVATRHGTNSTPLVRAEKQTLKALTDDPLFSAVKW